MKVKMLKTVGNFIKDNMSVYDIKISYTLIF